MINNYLLLDLGNSCIKAAIFNKEKNKIENQYTFDNTASFLTTLKKENVNNLSKIVFVSSANKKETNELLRQIKDLCSNTSIIQITRKNFINDIDLSNVNKDVVIGDDILLSAYYLIHNYKTNALFCLGTVYFCVITKGNKILSVELTPNITSGLLAISTTTSIPSNLIPTVYDKDIGLNTPDAFASGAKTMLEGYVDLIAKKFNLKSKDIIISGGDSDKYLSLSNKYHFIKYGSLEALAYLIKDKNL